MENQSEKPEFLEFKNIPDYGKLIETPFVKDDKSLNTAHEILKDTKIGKEDPYGFLIFRLTGRNVKARDAVKHWKQILYHKCDLEKRIGRLINIRVAALDYFNVIGNEDDYLKLIEKSNRRQVEETVAEDWLTRVYSHTYFQEKLKEELDRVRRYEHSLSLILLNVDGFREVNEQYGYKVGDLVLIRIVKIMKKTIRAVDILCRYSGDQFVVILPNTNRREAEELAERISKNIAERTRYIHEIKGGVTVSAVATQRSKDDVASQDLVKKLENLMKSKKEERKKKV